MSGSCANMLSIVKTFIHVSVQISSHSPHGPAYLEKDKPGHPCKDSFNSSTGDNEAQELSGWYTENAFFRIELDVVCSEVVECEPQVVY